MAAKPDPAEIGDVEPLADSTARQARRVVAAYATDADECRVFLSMLGIGPAKHRGVDELRRRPRADSGSDRSTPGESDFVVVANRLPIDMERLPDGTHDVQAESRRPGHGAGAAAAQTPRRLDRLAGHHRRRRGPDRRGRPRDASGRGCPPTTSPTTTRVSRTPRCGRSTTTSSSSRSTTASGGTATSTSTAASPRRRPGAAATARPCGSRTTSCSWSRRCCACCART